MNCILLSIYYPPYSLMTQESNVQDGLVEVCAKWQTQHFLGSNSPVSNRILAIFIDYSYFDNIFLSHKEYFMLNKSTIRFLKLSLLDFLIPSYKSQFSSAILPEFVCFLLPGFLIAFCDSLISNFNPRIHQGFFVLAPGLQLRHDILTDT